jgi:hypothetical protein
MNPIGRETDLSRTRPSRRANIRNPLKAIGRHRRLPRVRRPGLRASVPVDRVTDLTKLPGGEPSARADVDLKITAQARSRRGAIGLKIETGSFTPQGTAMTVIMLLGTGALLGASGFVASQLWLLPVGFSISLVGGLFLSPLIAYSILRPRS